ncbi:MAG TPA: DUF2089 domain-containing protein [Clostridiaceae bacterium]|nr:DUF2089 domain-containing protein [Clostridiaceae bacterium]
MYLEVPGKCPICNANIDITRITCRDCRTTIEGRFQLCKFCKLTPEQKNFIDVFIKCGGNIKEVERELGVSYPTVKNRLENVAAALGHKASEVMPDDETNRKEILEKISNKEISVEEAIELLRGQ